MAQLKGTGGADRIKGTRHDDVILGRGGDDLLLGNDGDDHLDGGRGDDRLLGSRGADVLDGGAGDDVLKGGSQRQEPFPFEAGDTLDGGAGRDRLIGGYGADFLTGGAGSDRFIYRAFSDSPSPNPDEITDFTQGEDRIVFRQAFATANLHFIGQDAFSGTPGEVRFTTGGGETDVGIDLDGNGVAEFAIVLTGDVLLQASDFSF